MTIGIKILWLFTGLFVIVSFSIIMIYSLGFDLNNPEVLERKFNKICNKYLLTLKRHIDSLKEAEEKEKIYKERYATFQWLIKDMFAERNCEEYSELPEEEQRRFDILYDFKREGENMQRVFTDSQIALKKLIRDFCKENLSKKEMKIIKAKYPWV